jgi:hypothetical protein
MFVLDGVLSENTLYVAVHRTPTNYQVEREMKLIKKLLHDSNDDISVRGDSSAGQRSPKDNVLRPDLLGLFYSYYRSLLLI